MPQRAAERRIESLGNLRIMVQTYEEIAAGRMQKVKLSVLKNRDFLGGMGEIYSQVRASYKKELKKAGEGKQKRNGKTVTVLLSANTGFYGEIIRNTFEKFLDFVQKESTDIIIVGKIGKILFESFLAREKTRVGSDIKYLQISDHVTSSGMVRELVNYVSQYERVAVFHGKFESIITQVPVQDDITGEKLISEGEESGVGEVHYIFEPTLQSVVDFFEAEIMSSLFEQAIYESSLSKYASRMVSLDRAFVSIQESLLGAVMDAQRERHRLMNKKQQDGLVGMVLWR